MASKKDKKDVKATSETKDKGQVKDKKAKHPGGRPTKYSETMLAMTNEYIDSCEDKVKIFHKTQGLNSDTYERLVFANIPTREGLGLHLNVNRDTLREWEAKYPEFSAALERLDHKQREMLIKGGLSGQYNPMITKLVLSANHGMKERVDTTTDDKPMPASVTVNNFSNLSDEELLRIATGGKG